MDEIIRKLETDVELRKKLQDMWARGASADEVAQALAQAGLVIESAQIEEMLQKLQAKRGKEAGFEDVDPDMLDELAGGGSGVDCTGAGDCDADFKMHPYTVNRCEYVDLCDEIYNAGD